ncbi:MAG TPA: pirin family protein [Verrucomicrobiae bacterium]|nr:pirin family protein [Verrucomicrobiae bacterium]
MMNIRKAEDRGRADYGWLNTHYTFSFANYYDPEHMGFRTLRVINDDIVQPGGGFDTHGHRDMEIITYVLSGELEHKDSMHNGRVIRKGEFQYMAAGTGVLHSEFNPSETEPVHLLQIWIVPDRKGLKPTYAERTGAQLPVGQLTLVASKGGRDGSITINQDSDLYLAKLNPNQEVTHTLGPDRHAWVHVAEGEVTLNGAKLKAGDGAAISEERQLKFKAGSDSQVLVFDLN